MRLFPAACLFLTFCLSLKTAGAQQKLHAPGISCLQGDNPPSTDVQRTRVFSSPNGHYRAYAEVVSTFQPDLWPPCRTKAQLFVSSGKSSSFESVFTEETEKKEDPAASFGPIAWSPDSRWLALERIEGYYASDAGGVDFFLYNSSKRKIEEPDVLAAVSRKIGKRCELVYQSFNGFDARHRFVFKVADWKDFDGERTHCISGTAEWLFDPVTNEVQARVSH